MKIINPVFSIVIPTYNRPERLASCLEAITQLNYPRDRFEVIVVDDGSKTPLYSVVEPFREHFHLTLISQKNAGPAKARNTGAANAKGQYLVFTDDDCTPFPEWLQCLEKGFASTPNAMIGGKALNALPNNLYSTASQLLIDYLYDYYNDNHQQAVFFASNNLALPTDAFREIGCFDTTFPLAAGEDRELCDRWLNCGYSLVYVSDARINHAHSLNLHKFWRQHFNYGRGAFHFHQIRAQRGLDKIQVEPFSFYWKLLTYPFTQSSPQPALLITALFFVSQVANVVGFWWESLNQKHKSNSLPHTHSEVLQIK